MKPRSKRLLLVGGALGLLTGAVVLVLNAFQQNLVFFHTPSEVFAGQAPSERAFRIGGLVEEGSIRRGEDGLTVHFAITDTAEAVPVVYQGTLPSLFEEGKGAVVQGSLDSDGQFRASEVLARHDENYMPVEAQDALDAVELRNHVQTVQQ